MDLSFRQLNAFLTVANVGSFTGAAQVMHLTQGAVSMLVKELETVTGLRLFDRTSRRVRLSPVGEDFLPHARRVVEDMIHAGQFAWDLRTLRTGLVRVSAAPLMACTLLPRMIAAFVQEHPHIRVLPVDVPMDQVQQNVANGDADLGLGPDRDLATDIRGETLFTTPVSIICRPGHHFVGRQNTWADLKSEPVIVVGRESIDFIAMDIGVSPPFTVSLVVNHMATAMGMAAVGAGVVLAGPFAAILADSYGLAVCPLVEPVLNRRMVLYTHASRSLSPAAASFKAFLEEYVILKDPNMV